jgi:uncharacterized Zn finger protein
MYCPECGGDLIDDVFEEIEIKNDGIYFDANEVLKCTQCGYMEYTRYEEDAQEKAR